MTIEEIKELIRVVQDTGIAELEVQRGENKVRIRNNTSHTPEVVLPLSVGTTSLPSPVLPVVTPISPVQPPAQTQAVPEPAEDERNIIVKSPIVGTYYDAPGPGAPTFVKVGEQVHTGQVLCIIESMKLMNEIEAEVAGTIVAKFVENGRPVEYGESLFTIRPS